MHLFHKLRVVTSLQVPTPWSEELCVATATMLNQCNHESLLQVCLQTDHWACALVLLFPDYIRVADAAAAKGPVLSLLFLADNSLQMPSHAEASGSASPAATRLKHNQQSNAAIPAAHWLLQIVGLLVLLFRRNK